MSHNEQQTHVGTFERPNVGVAVTRARLMPIKDMRAQWQETEFVQKKEKFHFRPQNQQIPMQKRLSREYPKQPNKIYKELKQVNHHMNKSINI